MLDLDTTDLTRLPEAALVWSADSKWVAYGTGNVWGSVTSVYAWNGSAFVEAGWPESAPFPEHDLKGKRRGEGVKFYGRSFLPLRWPKPGELEVRCEQLVDVFASDRTYRGAVKFTIACDVPRKTATVRRVGKTTTTLEPKP